MAKASTHIAPGNAGYFSHNSRQSFSQSQVFFDEANEIGSTKEEAFTIYRSQLKERSNAYETRVGQKLQNKTVTHLSAVVNLEQHHTLEDLNPLVKYLETELDTKVTQVAIHRDEGKLVNKETGEILTSGEQFFCNPDTKILYFDKEFKEPIDMNEWTIEKNYHAHIEFMGLTSEGKSIKRALTTWFFRKLQDKTSEVLKMERGEKTQPSYSKEQMQEIKKALKPKKEYANDKAYGTAFTAMAKELGYWQPRPKRTKRKDTHDYKADKAKENELNAKALAKQKDLKAEIAKLRTELQSQKAERSNYAELEQLNKDLKERIKAKDLLLEDLREETKKFKTENKSLQKLAYTTEEHWIGEENNLTETVEVSYQTLYQRATSPEVKERYVYLENKMDEYGSQVIRLEEKLRLKNFDYKIQSNILSDMEQKFKAKQEEIISLKRQNTHLEAKISTLLGTDTAEELKTLKNDFEEKDTKYWDLYSLAYDEDHIEQEFDVYGVIHDRVLSYKERYEQSNKEIEDLKATLEEKNEDIKTLKDGYIKIEENIFGDVEDRSIDDIVEGVNTVTKILSNLSKYLNLGIEKMVNLFKNTVPHPQEVEKEQFTSIKTESKKETPITTRFKP